MSPRDKAELREKLFALRERLTGQIASLKSESLTRSDSVYSMEDGTDAFDRQFGLSLANSENEALHDVDEALRRLEEGAYGVCDECSGLIEGPRLKALPFVRTCISCQSEIEKKRGSILPILPTE
jgi:RNA polymerase-binding transcription factor DksA